MVAPSAPGTLAAGSRVVVVVSQGPAPTRPGAYVSVPSVVGSPQGKALDSLQQAGMSAQVFNDYSDAHRRGHVIAQLPAAGAGAPSGAEAVLLVSSGPSGSPTRDQMLPDVAGLAEADAVSKLQAAGFSPQVVRHASDTVPAGIVVDQLPSRASLATAGRHGVAAWVWVVVALAIVAVAVGAYALMGRTSAMVAVPDVLGIEQSVAVAAIEKAGLVAQVVPAAEDEEAEPGTVTQQDPEAGTQIAEGSVVKLQVVEAAPKVEVPAVVGKSQAEATRMIEDAGLVVDIKREPDSIAPKGEVVTQDPAALRKVEKGSSVKIVISSGPPQDNVAVPGVVGLTRVDAEKDLADAGLKVLVTESASTSVPKDVVISQVPAGGDSVAPGTTVGIVVSSGTPTAEQVEVPEVVGLSVAEAQQVITDAGLEPVLVPTTGSGKPANEVVVQAPDAASMVAVASKVVLFYSTGP